EQAPRIARRLPADTTEVPDRALRAAGLATQLPRPRFGLHRCGPRARQYRCKESLNEAHKVLRLRAGPVFGRFAANLSRPCGASKSMTGPTGTIRVGFILVWLM